MTDEVIKTHWRQNENKNYAGYYDLPNGKDTILTIESAKWEEVKNPLINTLEAKRVIRFKEKFKPFICNEINAQSIMRSTGQSYMQDCIGLKIKLFVSQVKVKGEQLDCLRVREVPQSELIITVITEPERVILLDLLAAAGKDITETCEIMEIKSMAEFPTHKYKKMCERLAEIALANGNS